MGNSYDNEFPARVIRQKRTVIGRGAAGAPAMVRVDLQTVACYVQFDMQMTELKSLRIEKKLTQQEVAAKAGISLRSYISYENDESKSKSLKPIYREPSALIVICGNVPMAYTTERGVHVIPIGCLRD